MDRGPGRVARAGLTRVIERGSPLAVNTFGMSGVLDTWERLKARGDDVALWLPRLVEADPEADLDRAAAAGARFVIPGDSEWPRHVEVLAPPNQIGGWSSLPFGLWVRGSASLDDLLKRSVAMVGARACSAYGEHVAGEIASGLAEQRITVVSGGSYGIDAATHRGALAAAGRTVAFVACGVDVSYPRGNDALFERIAANGAIVSELPPGSSPTRQRFYTRNRLVAASTRGTLVIEASPRSGSLNIASWARRCGRPVMAVPGPVTSSTSAGTHELIRDHGARLVAGVTDVINSLEHPALGELDLVHDQHRSIGVRTPLRDHRTAGRAPGMDIAEVDL
jgi:DNA processing protein